MNRYNRRTFPNHDDNQEYIHLQRDRRKKTLAPVRGDSAQALKDSCVIK
jgi:hypothetical protein